MEEGFETQRAEYVYNTDSVNFVGSEEDQAKVKIVTSTATEGFVSDEHGHVTGLKVVNVAPGENGPFTRQAGTERVIPADLVLISVGFLHPDTTTLVDQLPVDLGWCLRLRRRWTRAKSRGVGNFRRPLLRGRCRRISHRLHRAAGAHCRFQATDDAATLNNGTTAMIEGR